MLYIRSSMEEEEEEQQQEQEQEQEEGTDGEGEKGRQRQLSGITPSSFQCIHKRNTSCSQDPH